MSRANTQGSRNRDADISVASLSQGISMQPPHLRLESQVRYAENAVFSVLTGGFSKRPPTTAEFDLGTITGGTSGCLRLETLNYSASEKYRVVYGTANGATVLRIFDKQGAATATEATVTISTDAQTYLDTTVSSLDRLRYRVAPDRVYFANTEVTPLAESAETIGATGIAVGSPSTVTTAAAHGLQTGDYVNFSGSTTTPTVDGLRQVTVTSTTTFTIVVNVTVAGTATYTIIKPDFKTMPVKMVRTASALASQNISGTTSVASPTVVTTATAHGLTTGQQVVISGSTGSNPGTLNGTHTVTVVSPTTFSVPVDCSVAGGTGGSFVTKSLFNVDVETWPSATNGTSTTNPHPPFITNGKKIRDIAWQRNRLWFAAGPYVVITDAANSRNFYYVDATNVVESDRIWATLGTGNELSDIDYLVPVRRSVIAFNRNGSQHELNTREDVLSQTTLTQTPLTRLSACASRPAIIDPNVYFCVENDRSAELREMVYDDVYLPSSAEDVSIHVRDLMMLYKPSTGDRARIKTIVASPQNGAVFAFRTQFSTASYRGSDVFDYRTFYQGESGQRAKAQSAWSRWTFRDTKTPTGNEYVQDIAIDGNDFLILRAFELAGAAVYWYIERGAVMPVSGHQVTESSTPYLFYPAYLDCQGTLTGSHAAGTTTWVSTTARPYNYAFRKSDGSVVALTTADNLTFTASGNYSGDCVLGVGYLCDVILHPAFPRDERGRPILDETVAVRCVYLSARDTVKADVAWSFDSTFSSTTGSSTYSNSEGVGSFGLNTDKTFCVWPMGINSELYLRVQSPASYPYPVTVTGAQYKGHPVIVPR